MVLPVNVDASYPDTGDASRKLHQQHHDEIHAFVNAGAVSGVSVSGASVATTESTTGTYGDLVTLGPAVTVDIGASGRALVIVGATLSNNTIGGTSAMSFAVSGASTVAASDDRAVRMRANATTDAFGMSRVSLVTGLTPGSNTFTSKYARYDAGTASFGSREIAVIPL